MKKVSFIHRDAGTSAELFHYLRRWIEEGQDYWTLYLAFHGQAGKIATDEGPVSLVQLGDELEGELSDCVVYFGSCGVMSAPDEQLNLFLGQTKARAVIGYTKTVDWVDSTAMDFLALGTLSEAVSLKPALTRLTKDKYSGLRDELGFRFVMQSK